jgi:predicted DNA-binding ribbon-helix-helix protein
MEQGRNEVGQFSAKGEERREVRSIRLTDSAWEKLGNIANERSITRADLIEDMMSLGDLIDDICTHSKQEQVNFSEVIDILESALKLKANAGGAIKKKIRDVINLIKN